MSPLFEQSEILQFADGAAALTDPFTLTVVNPDDPTKPFVTAPITLSQKTLLTAGITAAATVIQVDSSTAAAFPTTSPFTILVDNERMRVIGGFGTGTWTVLRGQAGTTAAPHAKNAAVSLLDLNPAAAALAIQQALVKAGLDGVQVGVLTSTVPYRFRVTFSGASAGVAWSSLRCTIVDATGKPVLGKDPGIAVSSMTAFPNKEILQFAADAPALTQNFLLRVGATDTAPIEFDSTNLDATAATFSRRS